MIQCIIMEMKKWCWKENTKYFSALYYCCSFWLWYFLINGEKDEMVARGYFGRFCFCGADFFIFLINRKPAFGIFDKETGNMRQNSLKKTA